MISFFDNATFNLTVSRSRFLGFGFHIENTDDAEIIVKEMKKKYNDAKHVVWAYRLGDGTTRKYNSSEPSGTAGAPILSLIESENLANIIIVVVRYFGGVLLGTGGLVRAYTDTAKGVVDNANTVTLCECDKYILKLDYPQWFRLYSLGDEVKIFDKHLGENVEVIVGIKKSNNNDFVEEIKKDGEYCGKSWL